MFQYSVEVSPIVSQLGEVITTELEPEVDMIAYLLRDRWRGMAAATGSVRSGRYQRGIDVTLRAWLAGFGNERTWEITDSVNYAADVETELRPKLGFLSKGGKRMPAGLAVEDADPDIMKLLGDAAERIVGKFR